jgi:hypothetical protein
MAQKRPKVRRSTPWLPENESGSDGRVPVGGVGAEGRADGDAGPGQRRGQFVIDVGAGRGHRGAVLNAVHSGCSACQTAAWACA